MGELITELRRLSGTTLDATGAANAYAGTTGLAVQGALNAKAGTSGLPLQGVLNRLAGTTGRGVNSAAAAITTGPTTIASDTFERTAAGPTLGTPDVGPAWTSVAGTWSISSGRAVNSGNTSDAIAAVDTSVNDYTVQVTVGVTDSGTGLVFRIQDAVQWYLYLSNGASTILYKLAGGVLTQLGSTIAGSTAGDVLKVTVAGTSITAYKNGAQVLAVTDSTFTTGSRVGLHANSNAGRFDTFSVTS